jgi:hypothetical protein
MVENAIKRAESNQLDNCRVGVRRVLSARRAWNSLLSRLNFSAKETKRKG